MVGFETILCSTQTELKKLVTKGLRNIGYRPVVKPGFVYAKGKHPVLLVAHLDTVHEKTPTPDSLLYSKDGRYISSTTGVGGDDRCGVYMIMQIIKERKYHVLFCEDEETGGIGARMFAKSGIYPDVNYIVELDRRGSNDAVFYNCSNTAFTSHVEKLGFKESFGTFSDISIIAPALQIAAVNISSGYFREHTVGEYIDMDVVENNIVRVSDMCATETERFYYVSQMSRLDELNRDIRGYISFSEPILQTSASLYGEC